MEFQLPFEYRRIGGGFHDELLDLVSSGQSAVLLSLRNLGKRYVLRELSKRLLVSGAALVVEIEFPHEPAMLEASAVQEVVKKAILRVAPGFFVEPPPAGALLESVKQLCHRQPRAVVLLASNVDSLAHHLAQLLLREARVLVEKDHLTAVLTGEENLRDLVYGPESEFNCAHQFVLQGFDEAEFLVYMRRRREIAQISFTDEAACLQRLLFHTDGNIHLARAALWAWLEIRARTRDLTNQEVGPEEFAAFVREFPVGDTCGMDVFHATTQVVARSPEAWADSENLRNRQAVTVARGSAPRVIEVAGLAVREHGRLRFASDVMERFARRYYDDCRLGDLHAVHGEWKRAFEFYDRMPPERRLRPGGTDDVSRLALVIKAFTAELHVLATHKVEDGEKKLEQMQEKLDRLKRLFAKGCQLLLGVSDVSYWTFTLCWEPQKKQNLDPEVKNLAELMLDTTDRDKVGWQKMSASFSKRGALAILPSIRPDCRDAVVVSDARRTVTISLERQEFLQELLEQFASAYDHCIANLGTHIRLQARDQHFRIATGIVNALGETVRNPREALKAAGEQLLKLGYRRIMFALVDSKRQRIRGISDCLGEPLALDVNVAKNTDWALADADKDIQPWVVVNETACIVGDWRIWAKLQTVPPVNITLCRQAKTRFAFAVVPMFIRVRRPDAMSEEKEEVFGTIHVERDDGLPPSKDDIADLLEFGRQMAAAAHQSERVTALLDALHCDQDAVVVIDDDELVRFTNKAAAKRFKISEGWHEPDSGIRLPADQGLEGDIRHVIATSNPWARHDTSSSTASDDREAMLCVPLPDWKNEMEALSSDSGPGTGRPAIGAVLQVRNLTRLHRVFKALQEIAQRATDRESTASAIVNCVNELGYESGRFYAVLTTDPNTLISVRASGLPEHESAKFNQAGYVMKRDNPEAKETWACLEDNQPRIYQWNPSKRTGTPEISSLGLPLINVALPYFQHSWKEPGDVWVDLPLRGSRGVIGKLTIDCGEDLKCDLQPEDFESLKLFSALLGALLDALDRKETWITEAADRAMATCAHNIRTKLAALDGFARNYTDAAPGNSEVETLNHFYQPAIEGSFRQVTRIKDTFVSFQIQRSLTNVKQLLEQTLEGKFGADRKADRVTWDIVCADNIDFNLDADRFRNALEEMLDNSRQMLPPSEILRLELLAEVEPRGTNRWFRLRLRDNGPGIPIEKRALIFEAFFSERPQGKRSTGLGLNFVRRVVEAHGGKVWVTERPNVGAEFIIAIPENN